MLNFKVTGQVRTLSKHVNFETDFGKYQFKGSADLVKFPEDRSYKPVSARLTVFEKTITGQRYVGKLRVKEFDDKSNAKEVIEDIAANSPFDKDQLKGLLDTAMHQLHIV